ncbi:hypothetical protein QJS04_geneDACA019181 [Acorus gramineus]|uniref:SET domain-containing protein n=1 Tax=Acorus gramineus TaxID=55184 RepID=A0AAV9B9C6_ACOGR|nr:hypothetical protein QJS04_geneDACA019181 [Acorus gramineus]
MAAVFQKIQQAVKALSKNRMFVRDPRQLQFESDVNRLFLFTCYNRLGESADEKDAEEIIEIASKASVADQQKEVQENVHSQVKTICRSMDDSLIPENINTHSAHALPSKSQVSPRGSGLGLAIGRITAHTHHPAVPETRPLTRSELSQSLKDKIGYTLALRPSEIPHKEAGQGLFLVGEAQVGSVIAFYPGIIYSPAYYQCIPGYPRVDATNSYLITRYDGVIINAKPWAFGSEAREVWNGTASYTDPEVLVPRIGVDGSPSDKIWRFLSKPSVTTQPFTLSGEVLERRNPLAFAHFANHPPKGVSPNVMVCPYDFPVSEAEMRAYVPNIMFGGEDSVKMKRFGSFWFRLGSSGGGGEAERGNMAIVKSLVLVATRDLKGEELYLNYRLSNSKRRPAWYCPVDEEEDRRRWS